MFEYDKNKSKSNQEKHGIDFEEAIALWNDENRVEIPAKNMDEDRYMIIARIEDICWSAIYTYRNGNIRIISVRRSRENEKEIYYNF